MKQQEAEKDMLLASNKSLAEYNLSFEPKLNIGKQKLIELYQIASQLEKTQDEKDKKMEEHGGNVSIETAIGLIQSATQQAEEESEKLAEKFLERTLDVDTFVEEFLSWRKVAHLRKVKADKMKELASKQSNLIANSSHVRPAPPPPIHTNQFPNNPISIPPYPLPSAASGNLPYPIFPPSNATSLPYPMFPPSNMYTPRF